MTLRMRNSDLIDSFIAGYTKGHNHNKNLRIEGYKLINYSTIIALRRGNRIYLNSTKYSVTTTTNQNMIRDAVHYNHYYVLVEVNERLLYGMLDDYKLLPQEETNLVASS